MKFDIIYADPPWRLDTTVASRAVERHYPTMELEDIKALKVPSANNSALYLWGTSPKLLEALEVVKAWGFKYKTHMIWDKEIIGCGWWFRGQHELLLVGVKGKFSPPDNSSRISSVFVERRTRHSKKPDRIRQLISEWFPSKSKLELFAKEAVEGWVAIGNSITGNDIRQDLEFIASF